MDVKTLHSNILSALPSDPIAQVHLADPPDSHWSTDETGFLRLDSRIYVPDLDDPHLRVLWYRHDHPLAGHFGQNWTLELIWHEYTWPGLRTFVKDYIQSCTSCTRAKTPCHRPYRLLKQLPVPEKPWNSISMDFIEQLPSSTGFTVILVVVDRLSKQAIFIPTHDTITSPELAKTLPAPCILQAWCSRLCHFKSRYRVCFSLLPVTWESPQHAPSFHLRLPPRRRWPDRAV